MIEDFNSYMIFIFACCRTSGVVFFTPLFNRQSVPTIVKVGLAIGLALNMMGRADEIAVEDYNTVMLLISMVKEFAVGFGLGFVLNVFMGIFHFGGELIDYQMGYSMSTQYDPNSGSQISVTGNILTIMFTLIFFVTNSHQTLMMVVAKSFDVIPVGMKMLSQDAAVFAIELVGYMYVYALQLALPIIVVQIIIEVAVGILMKFVPNINVFVVNLQLKMLIGIVVIMTLVPAFVGFLTKLNSIMLERMAEMVSFLV